MILGNINQKEIIRMNHKNELPKNSYADTFLKKYKPAATMAKTFTNIIMILISFLVIK